MRNDRDVTTLPSHVAHLESARVLDDLAWFRGKIAENKITIASGSTLEMSLQALDKVRRGLDGDDVPFPAADDFVRSISGAALLRALRVAETRAPGLLGPRWHLLRGADVLLAREGARTEQRDRMWEVVWGAIGSVAGQESSLGGTENPDVTFYVRERRWGVECKVFYTDNLRSIRTEIERKSRQLEASPAEKGWIAIDVTSIVNHRREGHFLRPNEDVTAHFSTEVNVLAERITSGPESVPMRRRLEASSKVAGVMFCGQSAYPAGDFMSLSMSFNVFAANRLTAEDEKCLNRLYRGIRIVLGGE